MKLYDPNGDTRFSVVTGFGVTPLGAGQTTSFTVQLDAGGADSLPHAAAAHVGMNNEPAKGS